MVARNHARSRVNPAAVGNSRASRPHSLRRLQSRRAMCTSLRCQGASRTYPRGQTARVHLQSIRSVRLSDESHRYPSAPRRTFGCVRTRRAFPKTRWRRESSEVWLPQTAVTEKVIDEMSGHGTNSIRSSGDSPWTENALELFIALRAYRLVVVRLPGTRPVSGKLGSPAPVVPNDCNLPKLEVD